jgi:hypothetical protein
MVSFFSGEDGTNWWGNGNLPTGYSPLDFIANVRSHGYKTAQVKWSISTQPDTTNSWLQSYSTDSTKIGPQRMACRPATLIKKYLWDQVYYPLLGQITAGGCGFCLTGNSGGASQIAYSVVNYDLSGSPPISIGGLFPTSGPVHTEIDGGCIPAPPPGGDQGDWGYQVSGRMWVDASYLWLLGNHDGRCSVSNETAQWISTWNSDSIENLTGGNYNFGSTRVEIIVGGVASELQIRNHACVFYDKVKVQTPSTKYWIVETMGHTIRDYPYGLAKLLQAILNQNIGTASCVEPPPP